MTSSDFSLLDDRTSMSVGGNGLSPAVTLMMRIPLSRLAHVEVEHDDWRWSSLDQIKDLDNSEIPIYLLEKALEMHKNETDT